MTEPRHYNFADLFELAADAKIPAREQVLRDEDLFGADEAFFTSSTREIVPIVQVDDRQIGSGKPGPVTRALIDRLLGGAKPPGYAIQPRTHNAVAAAVAQQRADWGVTLDTIARRAGLGFIAVQPEQYDFVVPTARSERDPVRAFRERLAYPTTREALTRLGMRL